MERCEVGQWRVRPLGDGETVSSFRCGDDDLDDYILTDSALFQSRLLSSNYILEDRRFGVLAFFTLLNDRVCIEDFENRNDFNRFRKRRFTQAKRIKGYPAVKIGRLGVSVGKHNHGLGTLILDFVKAYFIMNRRTGCRFLTVDAYWQAVGFYERNGFEKISPNLSGNTCLMYYDLLDFKDKF